MIPELPEQKCMKSLFMNEEESDVAFKVQDEMIPAHKQILIDKSKYFAGLFKSNFSLKNLKLTFLTQAAWLNQGKKSSR